MKNGNTRGNMLSALENGFDMLLNLVAMLVGYLFAILCTGTDFDSFTSAVIVFSAIIVSSLIYQACDIDRHTTTIVNARDAVPIIKANVCLFGLFAISALIFLSGDMRIFVLVWFVFSAVISTALLIFKTRSFTAINRILHKNSFKVRKVIIVGDNTATAAAFVKDATSHSEGGIMILGYVGDKIKDNVGCEKLGGMSDLRTILDKYIPDDVVFAIDAYDKRHIIPLVNMCDDRCIRVFFLPVIYGFFKHQRQIEHVGATPLINIHSTPLDSFFNSSVKRLVDIIASLLLIIITSPIMIGAAIAVKLSSPGPVFFKQQRVGKMGRPFTMLKFRSMRVNVKSEKGWSTGVDSRKTRVGNFIRKTSIDELPQLFNVLGGSMSLVGPRPEVPYYVDYFKKRVPLYMIKHYVKPGITGLAQIKGLRGDTSIEERINCDIEYIENWTFALDLYILALTPFKAFNKKERYKAANTDGELAPQDDAAELLEYMKDEQGGAKKILYAASTYSHISNFHLKYIDALRNAGYIVKVMANGEEADYNIPFEKKLFSPINTACRRDISRIMQTEKFDAVILNTSLAAFHVRLAIPRGINTRVINIVHGYLFSEAIGFLKRRLLIFCEKLMAKRTDAILVMNSDDMKATAKYKLTDGDIYMTRGMGAEIRGAMTPPEKIVSDFRLEGKYVIAFVGELSERKNQEFLIKAHAEIKKRIPEAVLMLVGDGGAREYYESIIDEYDLAESVILTGHRDDACDIMRICHLYVSASKIEGMPFNVIEAFGLGKTVLASRVKGHIDLIEERKSGFLFNLGNTEEYIDKVCLIHSGVMHLDSDDILERYRHYSRDAVFPETFEIMKRAIEDKRSLGEDASEA